MGISSKIIIVQSKKDKKVGTLKLQQHSNGKKTVKTLGIKITISNWNDEKQFVYKKEPRANEINETIKKILAEVNYGNTNIITQLSSNTSLTFFAQKIIDAIHTHSTKKNKQHALEKLKEFLSEHNKGEVQLEEIDIFFVRGYYSWMLNNKCEISTANEYITVFKYFLNQAVEAGMVNFNPHPFQGFKKKKVTKKYSVLHDEDIKKLLNYTPKHKGYEDSYNLFFFMMFAGGIRISDVLLLQFKDVYKQGDKYVLGYTIKKTGIFVQTRITVDALFYLTYFLKRYDRHKIEIFEGNYLVENHKLDMTINEHEQGIYNNPVSSFYRISEAYNDEQEAGTPTTYEELVKFNAKRETKRQYHTFQRDQAIKQKQEIKDKYLKQVGEFLMDLKNRYPDDTIIPHMNGDYAGEKILSEDQNRKLHNLKVKMNNNLKIIQKKLEIKTNITNHMARHIFAQRLFLSGANMHYISMALGHTTLSTTEKYREQLVTTESMDVIEEFNLEF